MMDEPPKVENAFRVKLVLNIRMPRLDTVLLEALRAQDDCAALKRISRSAYKKLFLEKRIVIKGQCAKPSSALAVGTTFVDILGFNGA